MLSSHHVINEFAQLISYLTNIQVADILQIFEIHVNTHILILIACCIIFSTVVFLSDGIYTHWENVFHRSNKYNTKKYNNIIFLISYETFK